MKTMRRTGEHGFRRAAVANVSCLSCSKYSAGVVIASTIPGEHPQLLEVCLSCLDEMFDAAKLLQMRMRRVSAWPRRADYGPDWKTIHDEILLRDQRTCQDADHRAVEGADLGDSLVVHHIKPLKEFGGDYVAANQPANLITLCTVCHGRWHSALIRRKREAQRA